MAEFGMKLETEAKKAGRPAEHTAQEKTANGTQGSARKSGGQKKRSA
jgi:hypothetical protein